MIDETQKIDIPKPLEDAVTETALAVVGKWLAKAFRWLRRR